MKFEGRNIRSLAFEKARSMAKYQDVIVVHTNIGTHEPHIVFITGCDDISNFKKIKNIDHYELIPIEVEDGEFYIGSEPFYEPETEVYLFETSKSSRRIVQIKTSI